MGNKVDHRKGILISRKLAKQNTHDIIAPVTLRLFEKWFYFNEIRFKMVPILVDINHFKFMI